MIVLSFLFGPNLSYFTGLSDRECKRRLNCLIQRSLNVIACTTLIIFICNIAAAAAVPLAPVLIQPADSLFFICLWIELISIRIQSRSLIIASYIIQLLLIIINMCWIFIHYTDSAILDGYHFLMGRKMSLFILFILLTLFIIRFVFSAAIFNIIYVRNCRMNTANRILLRPHNVPVTFNSILVPDLNSTK